MRRHWMQVAVGRGLRRNLIEEMICLFLEIASANEDRKQTDWRTFELCVAFVSWWSRHGKPNKL